MWTRAFFLRHFDKVVAYAIIVVFGGAAAYGASARIAQAFDTPAAGAYNRPALVSPGPRRDCPCNPCNCADCQSGGCAAPGK